MLELSVSTFQSDRLSEVWKTLAGVTDPEIDESVTSLEFISDVQVDLEGNVRVEFRLPTYWCAPNFAFLMASDMRDVLAELPWTNKISVELLDHFSAPLINRSIELNRTFREAFPGETDGDLEELRKLFLGKAFERRQELLIGYLRKNQFSSEEITRLRIEELLAMPLEGEGNGLRSLYLFARRKVLPQMDSDSAAFTTLEGTGLEPDRFTEYVRKIRGARMNAEFNGAICRGLLAARKGEEPIKEALSAG